MVTKALRRNLLATTIIAGTLMSTPVFAQGTTPAADAPKDEDTIVVTGSLISNPNLAQSSPVLVTTAEEIALRQNNVAEEVLRDIPGIVPNIGSAVNNGNGGASYVDLRGLGSFRNVVLLDGNRIAPSGLLGRVDLNNIPLALVERVDALTGGASTTYGADAISGVVNFITRRDFAGVEISVGEKITGKGDGNYLRTDVTVGGNFADDRGNAVLSIGYQESDPVYQGDRDFAANNISSFSGTFGGSGTAVPSRVTGTRPIDAATGLPSVNPATANGGARQIDPTTGRAVTTFAPFNFNPYNIFQTPFRRYNMFAAARYEISDAVEIYTRGLFSKNTVSTIIAPSGVFGSQVTVPLSNPYLPAALRNQFCAFNTSTVASGLYTPRFDAATCAAAALATSPTDPNFRTVSFNLSRRATETGPRTSEYVTTIFDYRAGLRGAITDTINWDVSGAYGESENRSTVGGYVLTSRARAAAYATSTTACLASGPNRAGPAGTDNIAGAAGCVPVNFFGAQGTISDAGAAYLVQPSTVLVKTSLAQARAVINGNFGVTLPSATDAIDFAIGGEYRKYGASQLSDSLAKSGDLGGAGGAAPDINGGYDVYEAFGELVVPLVQDKPFFDELTVKGGVRYSSYKVDAPTAPKYSTTTYKGEVSWSPVRDLKFRGGYARAVRAPNIAELFNPVTTGLTSLATDPCAGAAPNTNANLRAVCLAQGAPVGSIGSITNPTAGQANNTSGGNLNVKPEVANTYTFGAVITPSFIPGLNLTVDYYNIKVNKAITSPSAIDVLNKCFRNITAASATDPACSSAVISRSATTGGLDGDTNVVRGIVTQLTNAGRLYTDGIDLSISFRHDLGFAKLAMSFLGNYTFHSNFRSDVADASSVDRDCTGYFSTNCASIQPKFQWSQRTTFSFDDVDFSVLWRHIDKVAYEGQAADFAARGFTAGNRNLFSGTLPVQAGAPLSGTGPYNFNFIRAYDYIDLSARFGITKNLDLTLGVSNLFNVKPPLTGTNAGTTSYNSGNTYPSTYDSLGRSFAASAKVRF
jgi:iron complex outermembrane recepter protein